MTLIFVKTATPPAYPALHITEENGSEPRADHTDVGKGKLVPRGGTAGAEQPRSREPTPNPSILKPPQDTAPRSHLLASG
jgi:hypothetical protein